MTIDDILKEISDEMVEEAKKIVPKSTGSLNMRRRLPNHAFADPFRRRLPIIDAAHVMQAIIIISEGWFDICELPEKQKYIVHRRVMEAAERFNVSVKNHECKYCIETKERVVFT